MSSLVIVLAGGHAAAQAPPVDAGAVFRVFLHNGQALPSYGEAAVAGDRVIFTLLVGAATGQPAMQLLSLPSATVDVDRTRRYANAIRAGHYAATRGEVDYAAMTQEVQRTIAELTAMTDAKRRLELAVEARRRLLAWSASTYGYRAAEVRELAALFDEVILELRAAAGERQFDLDLRNDPLPVAEPLLALPTLAESIQLAIAAASAADSADDRMAILRTASALVASDPAATDLHARVVHEIELETRAGADYAALAADARTRAGEAKRRGDLDGVTQALTSLRARDAALGHRRPQLVSALMVELEATLASVRTYREALDHYALVRRSLLDYERAIRPVTSGFDGLGPIVLAIRDIRFTAYDRLVRATGRVKSLIAATELVSPPPDLADVHATMLSALRMAEHAVARRRLSVAIQSQPVGEEASSAAAGALLLAGQAHEQLVARLYPPKIK